MRLVPTMYSSKRTPQVRPPSLLYTSSESMKFIEKHDKDSAVNFYKETSRQTRACSNAKQSVSGKRKASQTTPKEKEPPKKKKVNLKECVWEICKGSLNCIFAHFNMKFHVKCFKLVDIFKNFSGC